jgi:serine/threonine-protein kinase
MGELRDHLQTTFGATYRIERELGGGGMSRVFLAEESSLGRRVVVKVLPSETLSGASVERFKREISLVAGLQHPHIVPLLTAGEVEGVPYFTMPLVEGETLRARLARTGEFPIADAVRLLREIASALAYAHHKGIVHRDIKPENVLLAAEHAIVSDFGVAKALTAATAGGENSDRLTSVGIALGTPAYMAPEQAAGDASTDHRADIYAFGVVAYEVLTGRPPFEGRPQSLIAAHATVAPEAVAARRPAIPRPLASLVMRCLAKRPADRPQRADDLIRELDALPAASAEHDANVGAARRSRISRVAVVAGASTLVAAIGFAVWSSSHPSTASATHLSVAVLPMENIGGNPVDEAFTSGLTEELTTALGNVEQLTIMGRTSVYALKSRGSSIRAIADLLHVANVIEGSMRRSGDRMRIAIRLDSADGHQVWAREFNYTNEDQFVVQEEIAQAVVRALRVRLGATTGPLVRKGTADVEADNLFVQGKWYRERIAAVDLRRAIDYFEKAIARDPNFAPAYAWLGSTHTLLAVFGSASGREELPIARRYIETALEKDPMLADAHWAKSEILANQDHDTAGARREALRALELDPRNAHARFFSSGGPLSHPDSAILELRRGLAVDPLRSELLMQLGWAFQLKGNLDSASYYLAEATRITPSFSFARQVLAQIFLLQHHPAEAISEYQQAARGGGTRDSAQLAYGYAVANRRRDAEAILGSLLRSGKTQYLAPVSMAMAYAGLGDKAKAVGWLQRAETDNDPMLATLDGPAFDSLWADPRYKPLMQHLHDFRWGQSQR